MRVIADLHLHSKYSGGTSKQMSLKNIEKFAYIKGLNLMGTGDSTHPDWFSELCKELEEEYDGIYKRKEGKYDVYFLVTTEVNLIFKKNEKIRKIHFLLLFPSLERAAEFNIEAGKYGDLSKDGRPTLRLTADELVDLCLDIDEKILPIPAHAWTPWFGIFGSKSGFNSIKECLERNYKIVPALETGLSSDPIMNWMVSELDDYILVSNSDSHSYWPYRIGREANIFYLDSLSYSEIFKIIKHKKRDKIATIEVNPAYGKYHWDGHRNCGVFIHPKESIEKFGNLCPKCGKPLTLGVLHRVYDLADREEGYVPENSQKFYYNLPLQEILSIKTGKEPLSQTVWNLYMKLINKFGSEVEILLFRDIKEIKSESEWLGNVIEKIRNNTLPIRPGYDGVYGEIILEGKLEIPKYERKQRSLFEF